MRLTLRSRLMLLWVLCTAVLLVQSLSVVHRISHGAASHEAVSGLSLAGDVVQVNGAQDASVASLLGLLFAGHQDLSKCQTLDHLGTSSPASGEHGFIGFMPASDTVPWSRLVAASGPPATHYQSRAPPHSV